MKKIIAANWKMNGHQAFCHAWMESFLASYSDAVRWSLYAPYIYLPLLAEQLKLHSNVVLGAQNLNQFSEGAYTGEISGKMIADFGVQSVLIGHSERRNLFAEQDEVIAEKWQRALDSNLQPLLCVGETLDERKSGRTEEVIQRQLTAIKNTAKEIWIAYEPVWAIGTGEAATPEQAQTVHEMIKKTLKARGFDNSVAVLYGGSVNEKNAQSLLSMPDIDGALIGGASLNAQTFLEIGLCCIKSF